MGARRIIKQMRKNNGSGRERTIKNQFQREQWQGKAKQGEGNNKKLSMKQSFVISRRSFSFAFTLPPKESQTLSNQVKIVKDLFG